MKKNIYNFIDKVFNFFFFRVFPCATIFGGILILVKLLQTNEPFGNVRIMLQRINYQQLFITTGLLFITLMFIFIGISFLLESLSSKIDWSDRILTTGFKLSIPLSLCLAMINTLNEAQFSIILSVVSFITFFSFLFPKKVSISMNDFFHDVKKQYTDIWKKKDKD